MHSDLRKLLRFTTFQTKLMLWAVIVFSLVTFFFLFLYSRTAVNTRLVQVESEFDQRVLTLDNRIKNLENNVIRMRDMAALHLGDTGMFMPPAHLPSNLRFESSEGRLTANLPVSLSGKQFSGMLVGPLSMTRLQDSLEFLREFGTVAHLLSVQLAMSHSGEYVTRSYYYSCAFDFLSIYPSIRDSGPVVDQIRKIHESNPDTKTPDEPHWIGPYKDTGNGRNTLTAVSHLHNRGDLRGMFGVDIDTRAFVPFTVPFFDNRGLTVLCSKQGDIISTSLEDNATGDRFEAKHLKDLLPEKDRDRAGDLLARDFRGFSFEGGSFTIGKDLDSAPFRLLYRIGIKDFLVTMIPAMSVYIFSILTAVAMFVLAVFIITTRFVKPTRIAEVALQKAHDELEDRVRERTTELTRINEELKESREKYRQLFIHAPAGIYEIDFIRGSFVSVNDVLCEYTGYSREEFLGLSPFALVTEQGRQILTERMDTVLRGEKISRNVELDIINKDGSTFSAVLNNSFIFKNGRITGSRVVIHDISERKMAEKALKKSEERFRNLVESTSDWIWDVDKRGYFVYNSPSVEAITGYSPQELIGTRFIDYFPKEEHEKLYPVLMKKVSPGEVLAPMECVLRHKNGQVRIVEARGVHYHDDSGNLLGARGISRDITEKKRIEEEKNELKKNLDRARKMEALGLLAGGVAHDLNNILSGIINYPELILLDIPEDSPIKPYVEAIYASGTKAAAIVDDLITVARGAARKKEVLNLNSLIGEYLKSAEFRSLSSTYPDVHVHVNLDENLGNISISTVQIRKTLLNLVLNAVESVQGRGNVLISSENITLTAPLKGFTEIPPGDYVRLRVSDTGSGISPEDMERVFEPFYSKKVMGRSGTGLGLAIVWNTVIEHDGHIDVASDTGGTVFDLYFPETQSLACDSALRPAIEDFRGNGEKVLVVDDETIQRDIASQLLKTLRYSSVACESGEKAVEYLKTEKVDLVLLDMIMEPGMDGRQTYEKIIELHPRQKVVITTGFADTHEVKAAQEQGAGELLKKPYTLEELGTVISRQLNS